MRQFEQCAIMGHEITNEGRINLSHSIEVVDGIGNLVLVVQFGDAVEILVSKPAVRSTARSAASWCVSRGGQPVEACHCNQWILDPLRSITTR